MKKKSKDKSIYSMIRFINPQINIALTVILLSVLVSSIKILIAFTFQGIVDNLYIYNFNNIVGFGFMGFAIILINSLLIYFLNIKEKSTKLQTLNKLQKLLIQCKTEQSLIVNESQSVGQWMTLVSSDCDILSNSFAYTQIAIISGLVQFVGALIYGISRSWVLSLIIFATSLFSLLLPKYLSKGITKTQNTRQISDSEVKCFILEIFNMISIIKIFYVKNQFVRKFKELYQQFAICSIDNKKYQAKLGALSFGCGFISNSLWMIAGIYFISIGKLSIGSFVGFMTLSNIFNWPFFTLSELMCELLKQKVSYVRLKCELEKRDLDVGELEKVFDANDTCMIKVEEIDFSYPMSDIKLFCDYDLRISNHSKVAITGENGAGKTTLLKLLMGLYKPQKGNVSLILGKYKYTGKCMWDNIAYVPQNNTLFSGTIKENIILGRADGYFDPNKFNEVCNIAKVNDFVIKLSDGYDTYIKMGFDSGLSEGQIQRISLARALYKNAEVYFFDEMTSSLDKENETAILDFIKTDTHTMIMVAHKKDVINISNNIIVI